MSSEAFEISQDIHQGMIRMMDEYTDQIVQKGIRQMTDEIKEIAERNPWSGLARGIAKLYQNLEDSLKTELQNKIGGFFSGEQNFVQFAKRINNYDEILAQAGKFQDLLLEKILSAVPKMTDEGTQMIAGVDQQENARFDDKVLEGMQEVIRRSAENIQTITIDMERKVSFMSQDNKYFVPLKKMIHETGVIYYQGLNHIYKKMQDLDNRAKGRIRDAIRECTK